MENNEQQMNFSGRSKGGLFGFLLILAGTLFLAFNFGWIDPALRSVVFSWPVLFVVFAIIALFKREPRVNQQVQFSNNFCKTLF